MGVAAGPPTWVVSSKTPGDRYSCRSHANLNADERFFVDNRNRATTIATSEDPAACYSYDDYALAELDGVFYAFNTSGCSCPSPDETWELVAKGSKEEILAYLETGCRYGGSRSAAQNAFRKAVQDAGWTLITPESDVSPPADLDW